MNETVISLLADFIGGESSPEDSAKALLECQDSLKSSATGKKIHQAAREILHYAEQVATAETPQWQASFLFEHQRSTKDLTKLAKKALKD